MKTVVVVLVGGLVLVAGYFGFKAYANFTASSIVVTIKSPAMGGRKVTIDGVEIFPSGKDGLVYTAEVKPGKRKLDITSSHYKNYSEVVDVKTDTAMPVEPKLTEKTAADLAREIHVLTTVPLDAARYFGDKTWLVFRALQSDNVSVFVARYTPTSGKWEVVAENQRDTTEGSSVDSNKDVFQTAPSDLLTYARTL